MCSAFGGRGRWRTQRQQQPLSVATVTLCSILIVVVCCTMQAQSWDLRVSQEFQVRFLSFTRVPLSFIENSRPTQLLNIQLQGNLLIFPPPFTFIDLEWKVDPGEFVTYSLNVSSGNLSIMGQPMIDVPLKGNLTNTNFTTVRIIMPCQNVDGVTLLTLHLKYQVLFSNGTAGYVNTTDEESAAVVMRKACSFVPTSTQPASTMAFVPTSTQPASTMAFVPTTAEPAPYTVGGGRVLDGYIIIIIVGSGIGGVLVIFVIVKYLTLRRRKLQVELELR